MLRKKDLQSVLFLAAINLLVISLLIYSLFNGIPGPGTLAAEFSSKDPMLSVGGVPAVSAASTGILTQGGGTRDVKALYNLHQAGDVQVMRVDVYASGEYSFASFEDPREAEGLRLSAALTVGGNGAALGGKAPNATIEIKGEPKRNRKYHNFKIRMKDSGGQVMGQSVVNLKKAYGNPCRIEEKFAFDLFASLPEMMSLRTVFVRLYIREMDAANAGYQDYGLYTMIEQPDKYYLSNRGIDNASHLYVAEDFDFTRSEALRATTDPLYKKSEFEKILDIKEGDGHEALLAMLAAVTHPQADIDAVVDVYFDRENLLTWMAMNVLLGNPDCARSGYMLYKPAYLNRWSFIPADMSEAMPAALDENVADIMISGLSMFSGNLLYEKFLAREANVQALRDRMAELLARFDENAVRTLTVQYRPVLEEFLLVNPDRGMLKGPPEEILLAVESYRAAMERNVRAFEENLEKPKRVELLTPHKGEAGEITLRWTESISPGGGAVSYRVEVFSPNGEVETRTVSGTAECRLTGFYPGFYTWRVTPMDERGLESGCVNILTLEDGSNIYGAEGFTIL